VATVVWPSAVAPAERRLDFKLLAQGRAVCDLPADIGNWTRLEAEGGGSPLPPRTREWLQRYGFSSEIWVTRVQLRWFQCAGQELGGDIRGIELELQNADSERGTGPPGLASFASLGEQWPALFPSRLDGRPGGPQRAKG